MEYLAATPACLSSNKRCVHHLWFLHHTIPSVDERHHRKLPGCPFVLLPYSAVPRLSEPWLRKYRVLTAFVHTHVYLAALQPGQERHDYDLALIRKRHQNFWIPYPAFHASLCSILPCENY